MKIDINPDHAVNCKICGIPFEMTWGEDNELCSSCEGRAFKPEPRPGMSFEKDGEFYYTDKNGYILSLTDFLASKEKWMQYKLIAEHYSDPDNWRRFPVDEGIDANGSPVPQYFWIGDGGEFARKNLE